MEEPTGPVVEMAEAVTEDPDPAPVMPAAPRAVRLLVSVEAALSAALVAALFVLVLAQVVSRYVFGQPLVWSEELARFSLIWLTFIGAAFVMAYRRHIVVSLFKLGDRAWLVLETISSIIMVLVILTILPAGVEFVQDNLNVRSAAAGLPLGWVKASALVGFALLGVHVVLNLVVAFRYGRVAIDGEPVMDQRASI